MTTATATRPARKSATPPVVKRSLHLSEVLGTWVLEMTITTTTARTEKTEEAAYILERLEPPSDSALSAVWLTKLGEGSTDRYTTVCGRTPEEDACDCPSGVYRPGCRCRHMDSLRALTLSDRLPL